jgi:hypothetical protein
VSHSGETPVAYIWLHELAVTLAELGRGPELAAATADVRKRTPWLEAALALAGGDDLAAAHLYDRIGARPDAALARLRAARALHEGGREAEAAAEHERALGFYASVDATAALAGAAVPAPVPEPASYSTGDRATSSPPSSS